MNKILEAYGLNVDKVEVSTLTSGLINSTWKVTAGERVFVLQKVNTNVFRKPHELADNIICINRYLQQHAPQYLFVSPLPTTGGEPLYHHAVEGYFRLYPFVAGSHTLTVVSTARQAFEAAAQFGKFTSLLADFDAVQLHLTIPDFHNLTLRYRQFKQALLQGDDGRIAEAAALVKQIERHAHLVETFERIRQMPSIRHRVIHHDTKISNVLFDAQGKGMCVIDLDTVMPGYFISDLGDMFRTYLSPANEEEKDFSKIEVREDIFRAIVQGYLSYMRQTLTADEKDLILYAAYFLIYMQALRFLADYFNKDVYYGAKYENQNFVRAGNQLALLEKLMEKEALLQDIVRQELDR